MKKNIIFMIILAFVCGVGYMGADIIFDRIFRNHLVLREIAERTTVFLLFLSFTAFVYYFFRKACTVQQSLSDSRLKYRTYLNGTPDPIFILNQSGLIEECNPAAEKITGLTSEEMAGKNLTDLLAPESVRAGRAFAAELKETGCAVSVMKFSGKGASEFYLSGNGVKISDDKIISVFRDVTDYIRMQGQVHRLNLELERKIEDEKRKNRECGRLIETENKFTEMGYLISSAAQQWAKPLKEIDGLLKGLSETSASGRLTDAYVREFENEIRSLVSRLGSGIDDIRFFFLPTETVTEFQAVKEMFDLFNILSAQIYYLGVDISIKCGCEKQYFDCKNIFTCPDCEFRLAFVKGDVTRFRSAVLSIIYSALDSIELKKSSDSGFRGRIAVDVSCTDDFIRIDIVDNGADFAEDSPAMIRTDAQENGHNPGLLMAKFTVEDHMGGSLLAENMNGGPKVRLEFPRHFEESNPQES